MDDDIIKDSLSKALTLVENIDEKFQAFAFVVVLHHILESSKPDFSPKRSAEQIVAKSEKAGFSLSEMFGEIKPSKYTDSAIIIAYYLFTYRNVDKFNATQILENFDDVRAPKPSNINQVLNSLIGRGFLRKSSAVDGKKGFEITKTGIEYVEELLKLSADDK